LQKFSRNQLLQMHEEVYGPLQAQCSVAETKRVRGRVLASWYTYNDNLGLVAEYHIPSVSGHKVCREAARAAYDLRCIDAKLALARKGPDALRNAEEEGNLRAAERSLAQEAVTKESECVEWWLEIMELWDHIPDEHCIKHPRIPWKALYEGIYVPYIKLWGALDPYFPDKRVTEFHQAPGPFLHARDLALRRLSIIHNGFDPQTNEPVQMLKLVERPHHSNFSECVECGKIRTALAAALAERAPRTQLLKIRALQLTHVRAMHAEREAVRVLRAEATDFSSTIAFLVDDKLGSHSQYLPMPENERPRKDVATNYRYRQSLMGTFYAGRGNFYFTVPPMLKTGGNFGCTSFIVSLCQLIQNGRLNGVRRIVRQTDSGSDNVSWVTFALCAVLVKEGVFDQVSCLPACPLPAEACTGRTG
jgi:hypothetical protein